MSMSNRPVAGMTTRKHLCFDRLLEEKPGWAARYRLLGAALVVVGSAVLSLPREPYAFALQAVFFMLVFAWTLWPLSAARFPAPCRARR